MKIYADPSPDVSQRELQNAAIARKMAEECVVLLKNDGTLPLQAMGKIALFGMGARHTVKGGTGSGDVYSRDVVSVEEGLRQAGCQIVSGGWLDRNELHRSRKVDEYWKHVEEAAAAKGISTIAVSFEDPFIEPEPLEITPEDLAPADAAVYVIARNSGEGADRRNVRGDYLLYGEERRNLAALAAAYEKLVAVLNIGGVMDTAELNSIDGICAIVLMSQLGNMGGNVLADILSGAVDPSGRLTDTWAMAYSDYPSSKSFGVNDGNTDDEYYDEGIYVGYRYFESFGVEPMYPFGYGLSYTEFDIRAGKVELSGDQLRVQVKVTNSGPTFAGKEVVQLYVSAPSGELDKPLKELKAFKKTGLLSPGESESLELTVDVSTFASYSEKEAAWVLEKGDYSVLIGGNIKSVSCAAVVRISEKIALSKLRSLSSEMPPARLIHPESRPERSWGPAPVFAVDPASIVSGTVSYHDGRDEMKCAVEKAITVEDILSGTHSVEEMTAQLTVEEMAQLAVGTLRLAGTSALGDSSMTIPGAAGDTSAILMNRGVRPIIMADGPAGLRLKQSFKAAEDGTILPDDAVGGEKFYQYCTAIPIGWALSQSWNIELVQEIGNMIGGEMEHFGIDLWLAPALNIHRNPLCGRNFEYYSEDPLVSGLFAAAMTKGVMAHRGKSTVIKHFAANSQEANRYFTNSHISERALREIYLKGFEIAVKGSRPYSVMSSYNLLNGTHTANHYELLTSVLRDEWGFKGMVMTDWFTSQDLPAFTGGKPHIYPISSSVGCVYAGNDLQMPGCQGNVDDIAAAVSEGREIDGFRISKADLQSCAANIIGLVVKAVGRP